MGSDAPSWDEDDLEEKVEEGRTPKKQRKSAAGRKLVRWNRKLPSMSPIHCVQGIDISPADLDQLVLLCVDHVCVKNGVPIPWDLVAREIEPFLTGEAIKQHLVKMRNYREGEGRKVPEKLNKAVRRKTGRLSNLDFTTPKKVKDDEEDEDYDAKVKGGSLLWYPQTKKPKPKKQVADAADEAPPTTPGTGRGRKNATKDVVGEDKLDGILDTPIKSTGKRSRTTKKVAFKKEETGESDDDSPSKKQKVLRPVQRVNYAQNLSDDDDDDDDDIFDAVQEGDNDGPYEEIEESLGSAVKPEQCMLPS